MQTTIKKIVDEFFKETKLDKIQETEKKLIKQFGQKFVDKNIKKITLKNNKIIIQTNTIEAKTEVNLFKKGLTPQKTQIIIL
tara:strand:+ start:116 stop:361 length:246 start_codon:yes stop_codon:yes gene_type:complete